MSLESFNCPPCIMYGGKSLHTIFLSNNAAKPGTIYNGDSHVKLAFNIARGFNVVSCKEEFEKLYTDWTLNLDKRFSKYFCGNSDYSYLRLKIEKLFKEQEKKKTVTVLPCKRYCTSVRYEHRLCTLCPYSPEYLNNRIDVENELLGYALVNMDTRFSRIAFSFLALSSNSVVYEELAMRITGSYPAILNDGTCTDFVNFNSLIAYFLLLHSDDFSESSDNSFKTKYTSTDDLSLFVIDGIYDLAETLTIGGSGRKRNVIRDYSFSGLGMSHDDVVKQFQPVISKLLDIGRSVTDKDYLESIDYLTNIYTYNDYHKYPASGKYELYVDGLEGSVSRTARFNPTASVVEMTPLAKSLIENSTLMQVEAYRKEIERQCVYVDIGTVGTFGNIDDFSFPEIDEEGKDDEINSGVSSTTDVQSESCEQSDVELSDTNEQTVDVVSSTTDVQSESCEQSDVELSDTNEQTVDVVSNTTDVQAEGCEQSDVELSDTNEQTVDYNLNGVSLSAVATVSTELTVSVPDDNEYLSNNSDEIIDCNITLDELLRTNSINCACDGSSDVMTAGVVLSSSSVVTADNIVLSAGSTYGTESLDLSSKTTVEGIAMVDSEVANSAFDVRVELQDEPFATTVSDDVVDVSCALDDIHEIKLSIPELFNNSIDDNLDFFNTVETFFSLNDYEAKIKTDKLIGLLGNTEPVSVECCKHREMNLLGVLIYIPSKNQFWYLTEGCLGFTDVLWHLFITERVKLCLNYPLIASLLNKYNFNFKGLYSLSALYEATNEETVRLIVGDIVGTSIMSNSDIYSQIMPLYCSRYSELRKLVLNSVAENRFDEYCDLDEILSYSVDMRHLFVYDKPLVLTENYKDFLFNYSEDIPFADMSEFSIIKLSLDRKYYVDFSFEDMYKHFLRRLLNDNCFLRYGLSLLLFDETCIVFSCRNTGLFTAIDVLVEKAKSSYKYFNKQLVPIFEISKISA